MSSTFGSALSSVAELIRSQIESSDRRRPIVIIGGIASGKTAVGLRLLSLLRSYGVRVGGVLAPRILKDEETIGYSIIDLSTNATHPFVSSEPNDVSVGRFFGSHAALELAERTIVKALDEHPVVFIDEVGRLPGR